MNLKSRGLGMRLWRRYARDEGSALIIAVMVTAVSLSLALIGVQLAMNGTRASGVDRQRLLAINAAEAGVDAGYTAIQAGALSPPCAISAATVRSGPDTANYSSTITYYSSTGATLPCTTGASPVLNTTVVPIRALIRSTSTTNTLGGGGSRGVRTMEALVLLKPGNEKAIFANGNLAFTNRTRLTGDQGADADVYTNSSFACSNQEEFAGSVSSQGSISIANSCTFAANVWAKTGVAAVGNASGSVAGFVKTSSGNISMGNVAVTGNLYAPGTITYTQNGGCSGSPGKCLSGNSPGDPPALPFPILRGDQTTLDAWTANGYTVVSPTVGTAAYPTCTAVKNAIVSKFSKGLSDTDAVTATPHPILVRTSCAIAFSGENDIVMKSDLAIFADGGITSTNQTGFVSDVSGASRKLYWVVPYENGTLPTSSCTTPAISTTQQFSMSTDVDMYLYNPCKITFSNSSTHVGQIYGGSDVEIDNQFNMDYVPLPIYGLDPSSLPLARYNVSIVYKRETR
jgi:Tfp pilus assembly protein PilX